MVCVVRYSFLLISICLRSIPGADAMVKVTPLIGAVGNEIIIQCATDKTPQDGVYMYKREGASKNRQDVFYYYKDNNFTPKSDMYKAKVHVAGTFPNLNVTFSKLHSADIGLYWCEFNLEEKITVGHAVTWLWIEGKKEDETKKQNETKEQEIEKEKEKEKEDIKCPEDAYVKIVLIVCAVMSLLCIIGFVLVILKVKRCWGNKKYRPSNQPSDSVYEEMKRSNSDGQTSVRILINSDYQSTKLMR